SRSAVARSRRRVFMVGPSMVGSTCVRCCAGWRRKQSAHVGDLLSLLDDDRLCEASELLVAPIFQLQPRHVDRTLMMWNHHPHEIAIDVAAGRDIHGMMHAPARLGHLRVEGRLVGNGRARAKRDGTGFVMAGTNPAVEVCPKSERRK